ncbi:MAG: enoyl-CoA hydratase/isomerase family protein [Deltaproteobacteria bacterium]|nr:enoyl-CoA hydratase/isomerase family protein [Deltaproteobacteria bacterium]MBW2385542.1 enoyl-CoA hydratase/isomerase family protein [Deltaproteobacteria bacterium]MBW2698687.1 enoyl-CoA hydratase/isomerase family protein [Deltaproteobacteria bacterium]
MDYRDIRFEQDGGVVTLTLHRPDQRNTFTGRMGEELSDAYRVCDRDDSVRAVVLTGAGSTFCAGADMSAGEATFGSQDASTFSATPVTMRAFEVRKPVIAALNGHAIGIGLTLALQCDLRIAAQEAKYGVLQVRRGVMPDCGAHWTLPRLVGFAKAADILLTGRKFQGDEAVELGVASRALPAAEVLPAALEIAHDLAKNTAPLSVAIAKKLLWQSSELTVAQVEHMETVLHHHLMGRADAVEGVMAFLERRAPNWTSSVRDDWPEWPSADDLDT